MRLFDMGNETTKKPKHIKRKKALSAANYYNFETCKVILLAAKELDQARILQLTKSYINYMGPAFRDLHLEMQLNLE